jgi:hypothetical protein
VVSHLERINHTVGTITLDPSLLNPGMTWTSPNSHPTSGHLSFETACLAVSYRFLLWNAGRKAASPPRPPHPELRTPYLKSHKTKRALGSFLQAFRLVNAPPLHSTVDICTAPRYGFASHQPPFPKTSPFLFLLAACSGLALADPSPHDKREEILSRSRESLNTRLGVLTGQVYLSVFVTGPAITSTVCSAS